MYSQDDLVRAIQDGDFGLVAEISAYFKNMAEAAEAAGRAMGAAPEGPAGPTPKPPKKATPRRRTAKAPKAEEGALPVPSDGPDWMAPSLVEKGRLTEPAPGIDRSKIVWITPSKDDPPMNLSPEQRRAERAKKKPRDPSVNRRPDPKRSVRCDGCRDPYEVHSSELSHRVGEKAEELSYYVCPKCVRKPNRGN